MFVKICGITNEDDALLAVAMGADAVGFIFAPSTRQVAPQRAYDITRRLPPEILTVGVFRDELPDAGRRDRTQGRCQGGSAPRPRDPRAVQGGRRALPLGDQGVRGRRREPAQGRSVRHRHDPAWMPRTRLGQGLRLEPRWRRALAAQADPGRRARPRQRRRSDHRGANHGASTSRAASSASRARRIRSP